MAIKRRKSAEKRKTVFLRVRITEAQQAQIKSAAEFSGISVSAWTIDRLLRIARDENAKK